MDSVKSGITYEICLGWGERDIYRKENAVSSEGASSPQQGEEVGRGRCLLEGLWARRMLPLPPPTHTLIGCACCLSCGPIPCHKLSEGVGMHDGQLLQTVSREGWGRMTSSPVANQWQGAQSQWPPQPIRCVWEGVGGGGRGCHYFSVAKVREGGLLLSPSFV